MEETLHDLLRANDLREAVSWLLRYDWGSATKQAAIQRAFRGYDAGWSSQQLAERLAYFLLVVGDDAGARLAMSALLSGTACEETVEICRLESDPQACFGELEPVAVDEAGGLRFEILPGRWSGTPLAPETLASTKPFVARLEGGQIPGLSFLAVTKDWKTCFTLLTFNPRNPNKTMGFEDGGTFTALGPHALALRLDGVDEYDTGILIGTHENFGHWLLNHLARLAFVERTTRTGAAPLIVGENVTATQLECLALMGYPESRIIRLRKGRLARFRTLWVPAMPFCLFGDSPLWYPGMIEFLRRRLGVGGTRDPVRGRRLFVTRRDARWRRLMNEAEVVEVLSKHGFEVVDPGALSMREQLDIAADAEVVMGPAGAGLNLHLFAPPGAWLVQLQQFLSMGMNVSPVFAGRIGQRYLEVVGAPDPQAGEAPLNFSFTVSPERILAGLDAIGLRA